jgi:hypothetical protein
MYWSLKQERPSTLLSILTFTPLVAVACLRGNVGTDTYAYLSEVSWKLQDLERPFGEFEPGFELVLGSIGAAVHNARAVVLTIAAINAALFYVCLRRWGGYWLVGAAVVVPAFYFDFTMNGLRIGMAIPLCVLAYIAWEERRPVVGLVLIALATSIQMTSFLLLVFLAAYRLPIRLSLRQGLAALIGLIVLTTAFVATLSERVLVKVALYEGTESPSSLSGLGPLAISAALALPFLVSGSRRLRASSLIFLALQIGLFQLTALTYAGTRLQLICLLAQGLMVQRELTPRLYTRRVIAAWCVSFFVLCAGWRMRNFGDEQGRGNSPYLPYEFFWQAQDPV